MLVVPGYSPSIGPQSNCDGLVTSKKATRVTCLKKYKIKWRSTTLTRTFHDKLQSLRPVD